jgi:hypothetical protein
VKTRLLSGSVAILVVAFVAACGGGAAASGQPNQPGQSTNRVTPPPPADAECIEPVTDGEQIILTEHKFPAEIRVAAGETVTWVNQDDLNHTVSFRPSPDCGIMLRNQSISVRFNGPGTYDYYCQFHRPNMVGKVIVE